MKKRILGTLILTAAIFTGCGGGGGSSSTTYDLYSYLVNPEILTNDKVVSTSHHYVEYLDGVENFSTDDHTLHQKYDDDSVEEYLYSSSFISNTTEYNNNIGSMTPDYQLDISDTKLIDTYLAGSIDYKLKRVLSIGDIISSETTDTGSTDTCNLSKHYESINIKDRIESFYNTTSYSSIDKTYNDVIEIICTDSFTNEEDYTYHAKNKGLILGVYDINVTSGVKKHSMSYMTKYLVIDK
jgi:hypothetical protein